MSLIQEIRQLFESEVGRGVLGVRVPRAATSFAVADRKNLYTVAGGNILLTLLYGICTIIETGGANAIVFDNTPAVGTGASDMDSGAGEINGTVVGDMMAPTGAIALAAIAGLAPATSQGAMPGITMPFICKTGSIGATNGAVDGGSWSFVLFYIPLDIGATVVAT